VSAILGAKAVRRLICLGLLALVSACGAPDVEDAAPAAGLPSEDPNTFRADAAIERPYAGEWASETDHCGDVKKVWTIEANRMGMQRQRFCVFERIYAASSTDEEGEAWSASAKCLAEGRESHDFVFFRVKPSRHEMRVTINDSTAIDLVRCPMQT
jgi:hypothetical protein